MVLQGAASPRGGHDRRASRSFWSQTHSVYFPFSLLPFLLFFSYIAPPSSLIGSLSLRVTTVKLLWYIFISHPSPVPGGELPKAMKSWHKTEVTHKIPALHDLSLVWWFGHRNNKQSNSKYQDKHSQTNKDNRYRQEDRSLQTTH